MTRSAYLFPLMAVLLAPVAGGACRGGTLDAQGEVPYSYSLGALEADVPASLDDLYRAALEVTANLGLAVTEGSRDKLGAHVVARQAQGGDVKIDFEAKSEFITHVSIRIGLLGDEAKSRRIIQQIEEAL